jgi:hypothetical protein
MIGLARADTAYVIDSNNTDNYPLMHPIPEFPSFLLLFFLIAVSIVVAIVYARGRVIKGTY